MDIIGGLYPFMLTSQILLALLPVFLLTALFFAFIAIHQNRVLNEFLDIIATMPLVFPPIVIGFVLLYIFGRNGLVGHITNKKDYFNILFTFKGLFIAGFIAGLPFLVRSVKSGINREVNDLSDAAYTLGKSKISAFIHIVLPNIKMNLVSGLMLAIGRVIGEVGISLIIGGNISGKTNTVSLEIYNAVIEGEYKRAVFFSIILCFFSIIIFSIFKMVNKRENYI